MFGCVPHTRYTWNLPAGGCRCSDSDNVKSCYVQKYVNTATPKTEGVTYNATTTASHAHVLPGAT